MLPTVPLAGPSPVGASASQAEDALAFVVRPRLEAAGADLDLVYSVGIRKEGLDLFVELADDAQGQDG